MFVTGLFLATTALGALIVALGLRAAFAGRAGTVAIVVLALWLAATGALAASGILAPSAHRPPPVPLIAATGMIVLSVLALAGPGLRAARRLAPHWVVGMQAFRIPVEIFLWAGSTSGLVPVLMSWHGRNLDVLSGLGGLVLGLVMARRTVPRGIVAAYHVLGLGLVLNVVAHAVLATPGPLQQLHGPEHEPLFVATFPFVWLPALLVPLAVAGHVLGLRQLRLRPETHGPGNLAGPAP
ncbi:MAG: hypothetical protein HS108_00615 [Planctomycetes bacterium]|jgi:hypothetical protein|nr:hypothetical protein [Planctomycetota bacterium]MCL4731091.1 hypothetical protein [Planctomycetota bacterium]